MTEQNNRRESCRFYSRPADESLAAYKEWIIGLTLALGGKAEGNISEEEWERGWRKFWGEDEKPGATF